MVDLDPGHGTWYANNGVLGIAVAWVCAAVAVAVASWHIHRHFKSYHQPVIQRYVVRILLMVPVYACNSAVSLLARHLGTPEVSFVVSTLRDCYESYTLYNFFHLCLCYCGGANVLVNQWANHPNLMNHEFGYLSWTCCLKDRVKPDARLLRVLRQSILQYVFIKLALAPLILALGLTGLYGEGKFRLDRGYFYAAVVQNASICVALYALVVFYLAAKPYLAPFRPVFKFAMVKIIIFVTFWQATVIALLYKLELLVPMHGMDPADSAVFLQNTLICLESVPFAVLNVFGFPAPKKKGKQSNVWHSLKHFMQVHDLLLDSKTTFDPMYSEFIAVGEHDFQSDTDQSPRMPSPSAAGGTPHAVVRMSRLEEGKGPEGAPEGGKLLREGAQPSDGVAEGKGAAPRGKEG